MTARITSVAAAGALVAAPMSSAQAIEPVAASTSESSSQSSTGSPDLGRPEQSGGESDGESGQGSSSGGQESGGQESGGQSGGQESGESQGSSSEEVSELASQLAQAEAELADVQTQLREAEDRAAAARSALEEAEVALERAEAAQSRAARQAEVGREEVQSAQNEVGSLAREMYQGGSLGQMNSVLEAEDAQELTDKTAGMQIVARTADEHVGDLDYASNVLALAEQDAEARATAADEARAEAERALEEAEQAEAEVKSLEEDLSAEVDSLEDALAKAEDAEDEATRRTAAEVEASQTVGGSSGGSSGPEIEPGARFAMPATGDRTSAYGMRTHPITGVHKMHTGQDFGEGDGNVYAASDGTVVETTSDGAYGNYTVISHGQINGREVTTMYAHQASFGVSAGDKVTEGQEIGKIGSTGYSTGAHLHFELRLDGEIVDPNDWL
ncbi:MAG TPA: M23 family metallopeptidase [Jiangellaceae bacterium]|nr:M23 family metallopeptidase [Jiangellaceae bacterium]